MKTRKEGTKSEEQSEKLVKVNRLYNAQENLVNLFQNLASKTKMASKSRYWTTKRGGIKVLKPVQMR